MRRDRDGRVSQASRVPVLEALEVRTLLSQFYSGVSATRPVRANAAIYTFTMSGPGVETIKPVGKGAFALTLYNTNSSSVLNVGLTRQHPRSQGLPVSIASIKVVTGQLGGISAGGATLLGAVSPLGGTVNSLQFGTLGPNAKLTVNGSLGNLDVGGLNLGPNGVVRVTGDVTGGVNAGTVNLDGGRVLIDHDLTGTFTAGSVALRRGAQIAVGRDAPGGFSVTGGMNLSDGGRVSVARNLNNLSVGSDLTVASGGGITVGGNLTGFTVGGTFRGQENKAASDLAVGLDLNNLRVDGGAPNAGGVQGATVQVGKQLVGIDVPHGIFNSFITAGVLIDGGTLTNRAGNVGADGPDAIVNSQILSGLKIDHLTLDGNVRSTFATNPASQGYPTRIVAGMDPTGAITGGGLIDHFQITGTLYDSVIAASVAPSGDSGVNPTTNAYNTPPPTPNGQPGDLGFNTYDAPGGTTAVGTVLANSATPNYTFNSYYNERSVAAGNQTFHNTTADPVIDDFVLSGSINPSFASAPLSQTTLTANPADTVLPIPTQSTVLGGVVSTQHGQEADFAGIDASDTRGVFVGGLPS